MEKSRNGSALRFEILGPVRVQASGQELDLGPGKRRGVLTVLLLNAGLPVSPTRIIDAVWGDEPPVNGANVVQKHISGLRGLLGQDPSTAAPNQVLRLTEAGYLLQVEPLSLDLQVFEDYASRARASRAAGQPAEAATMLRTGLQLWRGPALAGLSSRFFDAERGRLNELRLNALDETFEIELQLGRHGDLVPELTRLVSEYPLHEGLRAQLMLALYRSGRAAEALAVFRQARQALSEELGIEPGDKLQQLHHHILTTDPRLGGSAESRLVDLPQQPVPIPPSASVVGHTHWAPIDPLPLAFRLGTFAAMVLVPLLSFGFATWAVMTYAAVRLRSWVTAGAAAFYLVLICIATVLAATPEAAQRNVLYLLIAVMLTSLGGAVHGLILRERLHRHKAESGGPFIALAMHRYVLRQQAIQILERDPGLARQLGIGRPDLPRQFEDGGLVDLNGVPESVLAALPGVGPYHARQIVHVRGQAHGFAAVDELVHLGLLPKPVVDNLRGTLIALR